MGLFTSDEQKQKNLINAQLEADKDLAQFTFNQNKQALDDERRYNSPSAQLMRLRSAGLNPLYFGLDGNSSNGSPFTMSTPSADVGGIAQAVQQQNSNMQAAFGQVLTASKNFAEIQQMQEQNKLIAAQTRKTQSESRNLDIDADWKPIKNGSELAVNGSIIRVNNSEVPKNESITEYQRQIKEESVERVNQLQAQTDEIRKSIEELNSRIPLNEANTASSWADAFLKKQLGIKAQKESAYIDQLRLTEEANTQVRWEDVYQSQVKSGFIAKQLQQEFDLKKTQIKEIQAHTKNLTALSSLYNTQNRNEQVNILFKGMEYGVLMDKDGKIQISPSSVIRRSRFNEVYNYVTKLQNVLQNALDHAETRSNILNNVSPLKLGTNPVKATKLTPKMSAQGRNSQGVRVRSVRHKKGMK